jgi:hypothetical protein
MGSRWICWVGLSQVETVGECRVLLGQAERVPVRLIAYRVSEERARRQRQRLYGYARRKGGTPTRKALALANWVVLVTNVPEERLRAEEVWVLARVRWQVEILFRVWKRHARIDAWRSGNVWRILCELYAKLMGVVVLHWLLLVARGGCMGSECVQGGAGCCRSCRCCWPLIGVLGVGWLGWYCCLGRVCGVVE